MGDLILFADVEDDLRKHFNTTLPGFGFAQTSYVKRPATLPDSFIYIHRTGGPRRDMVTDNPQLTIECYGRSKQSPDESLAFRVAQFVRSIMNALEGNLLGGNQVDNVNEFSGAYNDPDPLAPTHSRFTATYQLAVRGEVL